MSWFCTGCCMEQSSYATEKCANSKCQLPRASVGIDDDMRRPRKRTTFLRDDYCALFGSSFGPRSIARKSVKKAASDTVSKSIVPPPTDSNPYIDAVAERAPLSPLGDGLWHEQDFEDLLELRAEDIVAFIMGDYGEGDTAPLS